MTMGFLAGFLGSGAGALTGTQSAQIATAARRQPVATIAALKALTPAIGDAVIVLGYAAPGDGGDGTFFYDSASVVADNGGTVIAPNAGGGRWIRAFSGPVNVKWFSSLSSFIAFADDVSNRPVLAYAPKGEYAWPDGVAWPMGLYMVGDPVSASGTTPVFGTRFSSSDRIVQAVGSAHITGGENITFLNGFTVKKQCTHFTRCLFTGKGAAVDSTGSSPYYISFKNCMFYPASGEDGLYITGTSNNANYATECSFSLPAGGRAIHINSSTANGWQITGSIDISQGGNPVVPLPSKSMVYVNGASCYMRFPYVESRRPPVYTDGAPIVFGPDAINCVVEHGTSSMLYALHTAPFRYNRATKLGMTTRLKTGGTLNVSQFCPKDIVVVSSFSTLYMPPAMQRPGETFRVYCDGSQQATISAAQYAVSATVSNGGSGYAVGDALLVSGGTVLDSQFAGLVVTGVSGGAVTSVGVAQTGWYSAMPANPVSVTGGSGSGATFTITSRQDFFNVSTVFAWTIDKGQTVEMTAYEDAASPYWISNPVGPHGGEETVTGATPSVRTRKRKYITANASPTTTTYFNNSLEGQAWLLEAGDANTTLKCTGTNLVNYAGASDIAMVLGTVVRCTNINGTQILCEKLYP